MDETQDLQSNRFRLEQDADERGIYFDQASKDFLTERTPPRLLCFTNVEKVVVIRASFEAHLRPRMVHKFIGPIVLPC